MTHYLAAEKFWSFRSKVLCGTTEWSSASDRPETVTCAHCRSLLATTESLKPKKRNQKKDRR